MTRSNTKMVVLSAVLALPPVFLAGVLVGNPAPRPAPVPAVAGYNEPQVDATRPKSQGIAQLFAALRDDARGR